jgi:hypothetical protein
MEDRENLDRAEKIKVKSLFASSVTPAAASGKVRVVLRLNIKRRTLIVVPLNY